MISILMQYPGTAGSRNARVQKYDSGLHCNSIRNMKTNPAMTVKIMTVYKVQI